MSFAVSRAGLPIVVTFAIIDPDAYTPEGDHEAQEAAYNAERDAAVFTFWHDLLPGGQWQALMRQHPPTKEGDDFNMETFGPAAIQACVTRWERRADGAIAEGGMLEDDQVDEIWAWPDWARLRLFRNLERQNLMGAGLGKVQLLPNAAGGKATPTG